MITQPWQEINDCPSQHAFSATCFTNQPNHLSFVNSYVNILKDCTRNSIHLDLTVRLETFNNVFSNHPFFGLVNIRSSSPIILNDITVKIINSPGKGNLPPALRNCARD